MQRWVVVDHDVKLGERLSDILVETDRVLNSRRKIVGHTDEDAINPGIAEQLALFRHLAGMGRGHANEERNTLLVGGRRLMRQHIEFIHQQGMAFAKAARCGDDIHPVADHTVDPVMKPTHINRRTRLEIGGVVGGESWHHGHEARHIFCRKHSSPLDLLAD